jgi:hypothetical protein
LEERALTQILRLLGRIVTVEEFALEQLHGYDGENELKDVVDDENV